ncbi:hypothetical protein [Hyphomonas sp.]|uniref:hypothetical protein n=1 Tax=Hyphomonas sp. TaxID=87 RepID=UPI0025BE49E9|nr:hypothetical protein [Hyphomonas sp.]
MSTRNLPAPFFPYPPDSYDQNYFSDIVRSFALYIEQQRNPGESRATKMTFTNLPSGNDTEIENGALFEVDGVVKISKLNRPHCASNSATSGLGSVTVTIG